MLIPYKFNRLGISNTTFKNLNFLTFTAVDEISSIKITQIGTPNTIDLYYRTSSNLSWLPYTMNTEVTLLEDLSVQFWNKRAIFSKDPSNYFKFVMTGKILGSGNIQALLNFSKNTHEYCFIYLFDECTSLIKSPGLPSMVLTRGCYQRMLSSTSLTVMPYLPATTLAPLCYLGMFYNCILLTETTKLCATTLAVNCYEEMFRNCTALMIAPDLPATVLANYCYYGMFWNCVSLITAPILFAANLVSNCYANMFYGCKLLSKLNVNFIDWNVSGNSTINWLNGVSTTGTFYCNNDLYIPTRNVNYIPSGWSIIPMDVILGLIIEENGVKKFSALTFNGTSAMTNSVETFDNVYSFNTTNSTSGTFNYGEILSGDVIELGQIIDDNGTQKFASLEFDGSVSTIKNVKSFTNVYEYNKE